MAMDNLYQSWFISKDNSEMEKCIKGIWNGKNRRKDFKMSIMVYSIKTKNFQGKVHWKLHKDFIQDSF